MKQEISIGRVQEGAVSSVGSCGILPGQNLAGSKGTFDRDRRDRAGILFNARAYRNREMPYKAISSRIWQAPSTKTELDNALASFARQKVDIVVIDGGDGTVRDVLSRAKRNFTATLPRFAIMPSGKTNALAADIGIVRRWALGEMLSELPRWTTVRRAPLEIRYGDEKEARLRGFLFGTGAFVRAVGLAQSVHRAGAFNGLGVGLSLMGALGHTVFGAETDDWRRGDSVTIELDGREIDHKLYMLLGTTLERMPLGLRPFGRVRSGLKLLSVDAPPSHFLLSAAAILAGSERKWLIDAGYRRTDTDSVRLHIDSDFVLDGERFPGGDLTITKGAPIDFLVPA